MCYILNLNHGQVHEFPRGFDLRIVSDNCFEIYFGTAVYKVRIISNGKEVSCDERQDMENNNIDK